MKLLALRGLAYLIDLTVVYCTTMVSLLACVGAYGYYRYGGDPQLMRHLAASESTRQFAQLSNLVFFVAYFTLSHWYAGRTLGKRACGLRVARTDGSELGLLKSLSRTAAYFLSGHLTLGIGFALAFFRRDGLALHDLILGTAVSHSSDPRPTTGDNKQSDQSAAA